MRLAGATARQMLETAAANTWNVPGGEWRAQNNFVAHEPGQQFFGIHGSNNGRVMIFAGGIPLRRGGSVVGAIGVRGGSGNQDQKVATTGAAAFAN